MATRVVAILIFDEVEVLDFCGPFEVFSVTSRFTDSPAFSVRLVAEKVGAVLTRGGMSVNAHRLADCTRSDILLVPGGQGTRKEMHNPALVEWIGRAAAQAKLVLSVCTGALVLAKAGLLDGLETTTHHGAIDGGDGSRRPPFRGQRTGGLLGRDRRRDRHEPAHRRATAGPDRPSRCVRSWTATACH